VVGGECIKASGWFILRQCQTETIHLPHPTGLK
jgi:hypothetical protein